MKYTHIFHIADLHIFPSLYINLENAFLLLKRDIKACQKNGGNPLLVVAGDVFENKTRLEISQIDNFFRWFSDFDIKTIIIPGNHDFNPNTLAEGDAISVLNPETINPNLVIKTKSEKYECGNVDFYVFSPLEPEILPSINGKGISVAIAHETVIGSYNEDGVLFTSGSNIKKYEGFDIVLLGDIHKPQFLAKNIAYPGSLVQKTKAEGIEHGYILWDLETLKGQHVFLPLKEIHLRIEIYDSIPRIPKFSTEKIKSIRIYHKKTSETFLRAMVEDLAEKHGVRPVLVDKNRTVKQEEPEKIRQKIDCAQEIRDLIGYDPNLCATVLKIHENYTKHLTNKNCNVFRINYIEWSNIYCYGFDNYINFDELDLIAILSAPNMAGKSTIFDVIHLCLFGSVIRGNIPDLRNDKAKPCKVAMNFTVENKKFRIERSWKTERINDIKWMEDGKLITDATSTWTSKRLTELLGTTSAQFLSISMTHGSVVRNSFVDTTPKTLNQILFSLTGVDDLENAYNTALNDLKHIKNKIKLSADDLALEKYALNSEKTLQNILDEISARKDKYKKIEDEICDLNEKERKIPQFRLKYTREIEQPLLKFEDCSEELAERYDESLPRENIILREFEEPRGKYNSVAKYIELELVPVSDEMGRKMTPGERKEYDSYIAAGLHTITELEKTELSALLQKNIINPRDCDLVEPRLMEKHKIDFLPEIPLHLPEEPEYMTFDEKEPEKEKVPKMYLIELPKFYPANIQANFPEFSSRKFSLKKPEKPVKVDKPECGLPGNYHGYLIFSGGCHSCEKNKKLTSKERNLEDQWKKYEMYKLYLEKLKHYEEEEKKFIFEEEERKKEYYSQKSIFEKAKSDEKARLKEHKQMCAEIEAKNKEIKEKNAAVEKDIEEKFNRRKSSFTERKLHIERLNSEMRAKYEAAQKRYEEAVKIKKHNSRQAELEKLNEEILRKNMEKLEKYHENQKNRLRYDRLLFLRKCERVAELEELKRKDEIFEARELNDKINYARKKHHEYSINLLYKKHYDSLSYYFYEFEKEKKEIKAKVKELAAELSAINAEIDNLLRKEGKVQEILIEAERKRKVLSDLEMEAAPLQKYAEIMSSKDGILAKVKKNILDDLMLRINVLLAKYTTFTLSYDILKGIKIINENGKIHPISTSSGFQRFLLDLLFRSVISSMATISCSRRLFIDEGFGCLDTENFREVMNVIQEMNIPMFIITHFELLKSNIKTNIMITFENDQSKLQYGSKMTAESAESEVRIIPTYEKMLAASAFVEDSEAGFVWKCLACNKSYKTGNLSTGPQKHCKAKKKDVIQNHERFLESAS